MKIASSLNFKKFLIMPPAYYKYGDTEVIEFCPRIIKSIPDCEIIFIILRSCVDINLVKIVLKNS